MKGLPASGKSTWAKTQVNNNTIRINKDDIRAMMGGEFSKLKENIVLEMRDKAIDVALKQGLCVIVDDTNFVPKHEDRLKELALENKADFQVKFIDTSLQDCLDRDEIRKDSVGKEVIINMYNTFLKVEKTYPVIKYNQNLADCIIVDIDGTLAHMQGRSPYDYTLVHTDTIDKIILGIVKKMENIALSVIIVSGRPDSCIEQTHKWLEDNNVPYDKLLMRKTGDERRDDIIKSEIYDSEIKEKYNVLFVLDDRDRVVKMWREKGLKCLQVAEGNF